MRQIFVFGSNLAGKHFGGAARYAAENCGAQMGVGEGITGSAYALPTLDGNFQQRSLEEIAESVKLFVLFAATHPEMSFRVTRVGCGIAGFTDDQIAPMFAEFCSLSDARHPKNCVFDPLWARFDLRTWEVE